MGFAVDIENRRLSSVDHHPFIACNTTLNAKISAELKAKVLFNEKCCFCFKYAQNVTLHMHCTSF